MAHRSSKLALDNGLAFFDLASRIRRIMAKQNWMAHGMGSNCHTWIYSQHGGYLIERLQWDYPHGDAAPRCGA
jgi:hypothetical protein